MQALPLLVGVANLFVAALVAALALPLVCGKVGRNRFYGVRFAKSFESDEAWYAINRYGGRRMIVWSVPVALAGLVALFAPAFVALLCGAAPLLYVVACVEAYRYSRRL